MRAGTYWINNPPLKLTGETTEKNEELICKDVKSKLTKIDTTLLNY